MFWTNWNLSNTKLRNFQAKSINKFWLGYIFTLMIDILSFIYFKGRQHLVEINAWLREDTELVFCFRIKTNVSDFFFAQNFCLWHRNKFLIQHVVYRNLEIRKATNDNEELSIPRKCHSLGFQSCVHLELGNKFLARKLENVTFRLKSVLCYSNKISSLICCKCAEACGSWASDLKV